MSRRAQAVAFWNAALALFLFTNGWLRTKRRQVSLYDVDTEIWRLSAFYPWWHVAVVVVLGIVLVVLAIGLIERLPGAVRWTRRIHALLLPAWGYWALKVPSVGSFIFLGGSIAVVLLLLRQTGSSTVRDEPERSPPFSPGDEATLTAQGPIARFMAGLARLRDDIFGPVPLAWLGMAAVALGVAARLVAPFVMDVRADGATYAAMGHAWLEHKAFLMPWGDVTVWGDHPPAYSRHYPPAYPFTLGLFYAVLGFGLWQTKLAALVVSVAALLVVFYLTRDLYGRTVAWATTGVLAVDPHLIWSTGTNFSENLVLIFFALTLWGILKSLDSPWWIVAAAAGAALAYLTRSSVGAFFLIAGIGGFLWRFLYLRWRVFALRSYLVAIAVFLGAVAWWAGRNIRLFGGWPDWDWSPSVGALLATLRDSGGAQVALGAALALGGLVVWLGRPGEGRGRPRPGTDLARAYPVLAGGILVAGGTAVAFLAHNLAVYGEPPWHTSSYTQMVTQFAFDRPRLWAKGLAYKVPFFLTFFLPFVLLFFDDIKRALKDIRKESVSALVLAVVLVSVIAWVMTGLFWVREQSTLFWFDNRRYVLIAFLPLLWLIFRDRQDTTKRRALYTVLVVGMLLATTAMLGAPVRNTDARAAEALDGYLLPGMTLGFEGNTNKYHNYPYLPTHDVNVVGIQRDVDGGIYGIRPDYILAVDHNAEYGGYVIWGTFTLETWNEARLRTDVWQRSDHAVTHPSPYRIVDDGPQRPQ